MKRAAQMWQSWDWNPDQLAPERASSRLLLPGNFKAEGVEVPLV